MLPRHSHQLIVALFIAIGTYDTHVSGYLNGTEPTRLDTPLTQVEKKFMKKITGEFDVKISPADTGDSQLGMMLLDKTYRGELQGTGKGRMLTGMTAVKDSAGYVAIERIDGELNGKRGSFLIQHSGTMAKGKPSLTIGVIPDSGTGELVGLEGEMQIRIEDRKHFYDFQYWFPESK